MGLSDQYTREIRRELDYSATWLPYLQLSAGDIGLFQDHQFYLVGNLKQFGIPFSVKKGPADREFNYHSSGAISITVKAAGEAPLLGSSIAQADAGISVKFNRENAILFNTTDVQLSVIENIKDLGERIMRKYHENNWDTKHVVVTQCLIAGGATILVSQGSNSQIDLTAGGNVNAANLNLANLSLKLQVTKKSNISVEFTGKKDFTPLFQAWGLKKGIFRGDHEWEPSALRPRNGDRQGIENEITKFDKVDYDDPPNLSA